MEINWKEFNPSKHKIVSATCWGEDVVVERTITWSVGTISAFVRSLGKPFHIEIGGANDGRTIVIHEQAAWASIESLENIAVDVIDDLPVAADPSIDAPVDVTDEMDADRTRAHLQSVYYGEA